MPKTTELPSFLKKNSQLRKKEISKNCPFPWTQKKKMESESEFQHKRGDEAKNFREVPLCTDCPEKLNFSLFFSKEIVSRGREYIKTLHFSAEAEDELELESECVRKKEGMRQKISKNFAFDRMPRKTFLLHSDGQRTRWRCKILQWWIKTSKIIRRNSEIADNALNTHLSCKYG